MSRELKFRAWNEKCMNYFNNPKDGLLYCSEEIILSSGYNSHDEPTFRGDPPCDIMQYIGQKDLKEKEIYETDIVHYEGFNWVVIYKDECFMLTREYYKENRDTTTKQYCRPIWSLGEVIGNKHENPTSK